MTYPYVSRLSMDGQETMNDGTIPDDDIGKRYSGMSLPIVPF